MEARGHALARDEQEVVVFADQLGGNHLVVLAEVYGDDTAGAVGVVLRQLRLLDHAAARRQHKVGSSLVVTQGEHLRDLLVRLEGQEVGDMLTLGIATRLRQLVGLRAIDAALGREEEDPVVRRRHEEVLYDVVLAQGGALDPAAAPALLAIEIGLGALGIAARGDGDNDVVLGDEILVADVAVPWDELRAALVAEVVDDIGELLAHDQALARLRREDVVVVSDARHQLVELIDDLLVLEGGETAQLHVEDRGRLDLIDLEQRHEAGPCVIDRGRGADERNNLIERIEGLEVAAQDVGALLGLAQAVAGAALDNLDLVGDPRAHELLDAEGAGHSIDQGEHVGAEGLLQLGVLVEVVEHDLRDCIALQLDDQAHAGP